MSSARTILLAGATLLLLSSVVMEARGGEFVVLKEGTPVAVKVTEDFDVATLREGGKVPVVVAEKVSHEGYALIEAGAPVEATFMPDGEEGDGLLRILSLPATDGQDLMLRATPEAAKTAGGGAGSGQLIPFPRPGTAFRVYLSESFYIEE